MDKKKELFLEALARAGGIVRTACEACGVGRSTYYRWRDGDEAFRQRAEEIAEEQVDRVESLLMRLIEGGDTTATIFYLKTRGRHRGYGSQPPAPAAAALPAPAEETAAGGADAARRIKGKKDYIVRILKKQGKYTAELTVQATIAAQLLVRSEMLAEEIFDPAHRPVRVEVSREGNEREVLSPKDRLYLETLQQAQRALRALGMNTDSRERKAEGDSLGDFMEALSRGGEEA